MLPLLLGPPPITIHDNGDMTGHTFGADTPAQLLGYVGRVFQRGRKDRKSLGSAPFAHPIILLVAVREARNDVGDTQTGVLVPVLRVHIATGQARFGIALIHQ